MNYKTLRFERRDQIGILTLNRPEKLNTITPTMVAELRDLFGRLIDDLHTRVVVMRGEGRAFCAGWGVEKMDSISADAALGEVQDHYYKGQWPLSDVARKMRQAPQPIIAAVRGPAAGGGFSLALCCDVRVASESARFNAAFIKIGVSGGDLASSYFLPRLIGLSRASEYLMTGRFMDAATAERFGLVSRVVPEDKLEAAALELAEEMLRTSPLGLRMTKEVLNMNIDAPSLESAMQLENRTQVLCSLTEDAKEGPRAFLEKRPPQWRDR